MLHRNESKQVFLSLERSKAIQLSRSGRQSARDTKYQNESLVYRELSTIFSWALRLHFSTTAPWYSQIIGAASLLLINNVKQGVNFPTKICHQCVAPFA